MWAVEIANAAGTPVDARPALLVAANFEGDQLIGSELALYLARHLATSYASDAQVKKLLDEHAVYILPRVNPDGAEAMFGKVKSFRRTNARKFDEDNDGRVDEDGPEDLNGDGFISVMRVKDPKGPYMPHPDEARLVRRADAQRGEAGGWSVYWEGTDNDGDGFINEDGPGGVDLNRNFQHRYPYYTPDAGPHMVSEPETRAVMDYILRKRNVAAILTFGASDNLITAPTRQGALAPPQTLDLLAFADQSLADARRVGTFAGGQEQFVFFPGAATVAGAPAQTRPPGQPAPRPPATTVAAQDVEYFRTISDRYRALTGIRSAPSTRTPGGAFFEYGYYQFGVPSFSTPGWGLAAPRRLRGGSAADSNRAAVARYRSRRDATPGGPGGGRAGRAGGPARPGPAAATSACRHRGVRRARRAGRSPTASSPGRRSRIRRSAPSRSAASSRTRSPIRPRRRSTRSASRTRRSRSISRRCFRRLRLPTSRPRRSAAASTASPLKWRTPATCRPRRRTACCRAASSRRWCSSASPPETIVSGDAKTSFIPALAGSGRRQSYQWIVRGKPGQAVAVKAVAQKGGAAERTVTLK